jgi:putative spermidine/putrescine transport system ATP-binding protein
MVTHDQEEALSMADRVAVIHQGKLEQFAPPEEIYDAPESLFVNQFVGTSNTLSARVVSKETSNLGHVDIAGMVCPARLVSSDLSEGDEVQVCIRPEHLQLNPLGHGLACELHLSLPQGAQVIQEIAIGSDCNLKVVQPRTENFHGHQPGDSLSVSLRPGMLVNAYRN